jgi:hypothetical protein
MHLPVCISCADFLDNSFYKLLFDEKWQYRKWNGPVQYEGM